MPRTMAKPMPSPPLPGPAIVHESDELLELTLDDAKGVSVMRLTLLDEFERKPIGASGLRRS